MISTPALANEPSDPGSDLGWLDDESNPHGDPHPTAHQTRRAWLFYDAHEIHINDILFPQAFPHRTFIVCTTSSVVVWFTGTENIALHTVKLCTSVSQYFYLFLRGAQGNARPPVLVCARFL